MTSVKVAHITTVDQSLRYLLSAQMQYLQSRGYEITGISAAGPNVPMLEEAGIPHIALPMTRTVNPIGDLYCLGALIRTLRRERFSIIHTHTPKASLLGHLAGRLAGTPVILNTLHGYYLHDDMSRMARRAYLLMERLSAAAAMQILSQNHEDIETAIRERICPPEKISFLGNGIDLKLFCRNRFTREEIVAKRMELGIPASSPVIGFVGRLAARRKGFLDFLSACAIVRNQRPDVRMLIIGEGDRGRPDSVEPPVAADYGISDECIFLGRQPNEELPLLYAMMDVIVLPSLFEGLPRVIMEASAMGVPSVASNVKGNREAVSEGRNGTLVPYGDVAAIASKIIEVFDVVAGENRFEGSARRVAEERFDQQLVFERIAHEYARMLDERGIALPAAATVGNQGTENSLS